MVDIIVNNEYLDIADTAQNIKYTIQVSDIFDLSVVKASYTNSFSIPKNENNTKAFKMLGLVGDNSRVPYQKIDARLQDNGFPIIQSGWLSVVETTDSYKISIINGIIDFFKSIENKKIGLDLDISEIDHRKDLNTVVSSFGNANYKYIVAEYNGKTIGRTSADTPAYNIDYLVPSVRIGYLWDKIFNTFGYTYSGNIFSDDDFYGAWLTYPKPPEAEETTEATLITYLEKYNFTETGQSNQPFEQNENWSVANIDEGSLLNSWDYVVPETKNYRIRIKPKGYINTFFDTGGSIITPYLLVVKRGTTEILSAQTTSEEEVEGIIDQYLYEGEIIRFEIWPPQQISSLTNYLYNENIQVYIYSLDFGEVSFSNALADFAIKDFIKEIIWRYGLTPVINTETRSIHFYTIEETLNISNTKDWSNKYVSRTSEKYVQGSYARENVFSHKYNDQEENFNDGYIYIDNLNLEETKNLATSKTYSFDNRVSVLLGFISFYYPIWQPEPKEVTLDDGTVEIQTEYKGLSGRFFVMKYRFLMHETNFISEKLGGEVFASTFPIVRADYTVFSQLVPKYYSEYQRILNDFRAHTIELVLTIEDILTLDFVTPYYFSQESSFYKLNKITWESGKVCKGEFIRLKRQ